MKYQIKKILFVNDWGFNPNPRVFYIADYFNQQLEFQTFIVGREYENIPKRNDLFLVKNIWLQKNKYPSKILFQKILTLKILFKSLKLIIKNKPSLIYTRSFLLLIFLSMLKPINNHKLIYESHGYIYKEQNYKNKKFKSFVYKFLEKIVYKNLVDYFTVISKKLADSISKTHDISSKNFFYLPNGIDPDEFKKVFKINKSKNEFWVGFVGNWEHWIEIEDLLKTSINESGFKVVVIGEGHNYLEMKKKYKDVIFLGKVPKIKALSYMKAIDIFCSPWSNNPIFEEKSARKTFEYLYTGKPIIVSDVSGKEDFLVENINCLTYQLNRIDDLKLKIKNLMFDKSLRNNISKNNKVLGNKFVWDKLIENSGIKNIIQT